MSDAFCHMSDIRCLMFDVICVISDSWCLMSGISCFLPDVRRLISDVWYQTFDVWCHVCCQTFDVWWRRPMSYVWCLMSDVWCLSDVIRYLMINVWCHMSDIRHLMADVWFQMSDVRWLMLFVWSQTSGVRYLMSAIRCHFYTRILSGTKIEISRVGDFVRSYYQPLGFFFFWSFDYILSQSFLPLTLPSFTPIGFKFGGRVLSYINYIGMPVATCLGLESGMSSILWPLNHVGQILQHHQGWGLQGEWVRRN